MSPAADLRFARPVRQSARAIRVLIVDQSPVVRHTLSDLLSADESIEVVGTASAAHDARCKIKQHAPDVITLGTELADMGSLVFLRNLMRFRPLPVVLLSSPTGSGANFTQQALVAGAVDFVRRPHGNTVTGLRTKRASLCEKIKAWGAIRPDPVADVELRGPALISVGASTGGTDAIKDLLSAMPADSPGIVVTQHIPERFCGSFAQRVDSHCRIDVCVATDGQEILPGHAYIAPGDRHLVVVRIGSRLFCRLDDGPRVNLHKPSIDVLFQSVAKQCGGNAVGVLLTGMGKDGAKGLKAMRDARCHTIAQDKDSSAVWGMPGKAVSIGAAREVLPLGSIAGRLATVRRT